MMEVWRIRLSIRTDKGKDSRNSLLVKAKSSPAVEGFAGITSAKPCEASQTTLRQFLIIKGNGRGHTPLKSHIYFQDFLQCVE